MCYMQAVSFLAAFFLTHEVYSWLNQASSLYQYIPLRLSVSRNCALLIADYTSSCWNGNKNQIQEYGEMKYIGLFSALFFISTAAYGKHESEHPLSADDWKEVMGKVVLLEQSGLMPTMLPVIMRNQDTLELTDEQINAFRAWRKKNYTNMVNIMNLVIEKMVQFRVNSLSPEVSREQLLAFQAEIHGLQRQLLDIKLSCRELVMTSFTDEQWENFAFVVADNPKLASLVSQVRNANTQQIH